MSWAQPAATWWSRSATGWKRWACRTGPGRATCGSTTTMRTALHLPGPWRTRPSGSARKPTNDAGAVLARAAKRSVARQPGQVPAVVAQLVDRIVHVAQGGVGGLLRQLRQHFGCPAPGQLLE